MTKKSYNSHLLLQPYPMNYNPRVLFISTLFSIIHVSYALGGESFSHSKLRKDTKETMTLGFLVAKMVTYNIELNGSYLQHLKVTFGMVFNVTHFPF